jgi:hypothetical protein
MSTTTISTVRLTLREIADADFDSAKPATLKPQKHPHRPPLGTVGSPSGIHRVVSVLKRPQRNTPCAGRIARRDPSCQPPDTP